MKNLNKILLIPALSLVINSCKNQEVLPTRLIGVNVTTAVVGGAALTLNTSALTVSNNSFTQFPLLAGQTQINLYPAATPQTPYYNQTINTNNGDNYSLFLAGASPSAVDAVLIKENYKNYVDSLTGVRFINLSPNSSPISVNLSGSANGSEVASLAYKAYTDFKQYPAKAVNKTYAFQIRDVATGKLFTSTTLTIPRFHNVTIVLRGLITAPGITTVNDY